MEKQEQKNGTYLLKAVLSEKEKEDFKHLQDYGEDYIIECCISDFIDFVSDLYYNYEGENGENSEKYAPAIFSTLSILNVIRKGVETLRLFSCKTIK